MLKQQSKEYFIKHASLKNWIININISYFGLWDKIWNQKRLHKISYNLNILIMTAFMIIVKLGTLNERGVKHLNIFSMNFEYVVYVKSLICT